MTDLESMLYRLRHAKDLAAQIPIEAELNCITRNAVCKLARQYGIDIAIKPDNRLIDYDEVKRLYEQGCNDVEIGIILHISRSSVNYWRLQNGLMSNKQRNALKRRALKHA